MNIKEAKEQIKNAMTAYFTKNEFGDYIIPIEKQRPIFLMGAPGIGKTAIMEQVASELNVGLVSYSMTHHTRQSALGLPFIVKKNYGGVEYDVSEYTMSEIIASVYDMIETVKDTFYIDVQMVPDMKVYCFEHNVENNGLFKSGLEVFSGEYTHEELRHFVLRYKKTELFANCFISGLLSFIAYFIVTFLYLVIKKKV